MIVKDIKLRKRMKGIQISYFDQMEVHISSVNNYDVIMQKLQESTNLYL